MTGTRADGSTRIRRLGIHSRHRSDGMVRAFNCRLDGERSVKTYQRRGLSRLERSGLTPPLELTSPTEIVSLLMLRIPERRTPSSRRRQPQAPWSAIGSGAPEPSLTPRWTSIGSAFGPAMRPEIPLPPPTLPSASRQVVVISSQSSPLPSPPRPMRPDATRGPWIGRPRSGDHRCRS